MRSAAAVAGRSHSWTVSGLLLGAAPITWAVAANGATLPATWLYAGADLAAAPPTPTIVMPITTATAPAAPTTLGVLDTTVSPRLRLTRGVGQPPHRC